MKASVVCLLFAILLMCVFPKGNEGYKTKNTGKEERKRLNKFNAYDTDRDGVIDIQELRIKASQEGLGENTDFLFENADKDENGQISYEEFKQSSLGIVE
ncbi:hypothetical protein CHS0354_000212 [Potamilus streckersoni]|uniref:EF-hand domain-containing protein n=1 Tax=Potamilus streckersoni TaxID=2493646 RepID=A0AAE0RR41_9BIVA|nr:hypothetical protein CHS0354_000212 [Potamilus streckersoni]